MSECKHKKAACVDSRQNTGFMRRRYRCSECGERWTTAEVKIDSNKKMTGSTALIELRKQVGLSKTQQNAIEMLNEAFGFTCI